MPVTVAVCTESEPGERRVALDPGVAKKLQAQGGFALRLQKGAGVGAGFPDSAYPDAILCDDFASTVAGSDIVLRVVTPTLEEAGVLPRGCLLASTLFPHANQSLVEILAQRHITSLALELIPRISRAHSMNVTSSQGTIAGYKAALLAAELSPRLFPMIISPAGTIRPSSVVVIGAGMAGLQSIATARRLGAKVEAYDIRPSAREQVESLGASMVETGIDVHGTSGHGRALTDSEKQQQVEVLADCLSRAHAVICTAALPGRAAPKIISAEMVDRMPNGAVLVDLAARSGGNCELTVAGQTIWRGDKQVVGAVDLASAAAVHSSEMYSRNMFHLLNYLFTDGELSADFEDKILKEILLTRVGDVVHRQTALQMGLITEDDVKASAEQSSKRKVDAVDNTADWVDTDSTLDNSAGDKS